MISDFMTVRKSTGEIVCNNTASYRSMEQQEGWNKKRKSRLASREHDESAGRSFTFLKQDAFKEFMSNNPQVALNILGAAIVLSTYLEMNSGSKLPFKSVKDMSDKLKMSSKQMKRILDTMMEYNLIIRIDGCYYLNSQMFHRGDIKGSPSTVRAFSRNIRILSNSEGVSLPDIGLLFLIVPFISFKWNIICENPSEYQIEKINGLTVDELANIIGFDSKSIYKKINKMSMKFHNFENYGELAVFGYFKNPVKKKTFIMVNPLIYCRSTDEAWKNGLPYFIASNKKTA